MAAFDPFAALGATDVAASPAPAAAPAAVPVPAAGNGAPASAAPVAFPEGGGMLPDGSATRDPAVWARWLADLHATPGPGGTGTPAAETAFSAQGSPTAAPRVGSAGPPAPGVPAKSGAPAVFDPFAALGATDVPAAAAPATPPKSGFAANVGAGMAEGGQGALNVLSDPFGNLVGKPLATGLVALHDLLAPTFGYQPFPDATRRLLLGEDVPQVGTRIGQGVQAALGAPGPEDVQAATPGERMARAAAAGATSMVPFAPSAGGALIGALSGVTGEAAQQAAPERYREAVGLLGSLVGGVGGAGAVAGLRGAGAAAGRVAENVRAPLSIGPQEQIINPETGQPFTDATGAPITGTARQQQLAGQRIGQAMGQQPGEEPAIPTPAEAQLVPGSQPSLGQLTGNRNVLGLERTLRGVNRVPFGQAEQANAVARNQALQGLAGPNAAREAAGDYVANQLQALHSHEAAVDRLNTDIAQRSAEGLGGAPNATDQAAVGTATRQALEDLRKPVQAAASRLYDAIDPEGTLAVRTSGIAARARQLVESVGEDLGGKWGPEETTIKAAARLPDVMLFSRLRQLDSNLATDARAIRTNPQLGQESMPARRVAQLREEIQTALQQAAGEEAAKDAGAVAAGTMQPHETLGGRLLGAEAEPSAPAVTSAVFTPAGRRVDVRYRVAEADHLITSHGDDLQPNPAYPADLQPRDRSSVASKAQIARLAGNIEPERLGASTSANEGAPIVGPDGLVESGNGRTIALRRAYEADSRGAQAYRAWLEQQGFDTKGMKAPILVRERATEMTPQERVAFAKEANAGTGLEMSASERAMADAGRIDEGLLARYQGGDVTNPANVPFLREFAKQVLEKGEEGKFITKGGELSLDGAQRVRNALLAKAYGDGNLVSALADVGDENIRAFGAGLADAAPGVAKLNAEIASGAVDPGMAIAPSLVEAARLVARARRDGVKLADVMAQQDAFQRVNPVSQAILQAAYGENFAGRVSRARLSDMMAFYAEEAAKQSTQDRLFGANLTPQEILQAAERRNVGQATSSAGGAAAASAEGGAAGGAERGAVPGGGQGAGAGGAQARGPGVGAGGETAAERRQILGRDLTPNFTAETADQLRAANRAYADYKDTFRRGAVGDVLATGGGPGNYRLADSSVSTRLFRKGPGGAEAADQLVKAAGSPEKAVEVLGDYPALAFRRYAERDGMIEPKRADAWLADHKAALDRLPGLRAKFADTATATRTLQEASERAQAAIKQFQDSAARHYLTRAGEPVDAKTAVNRLVGSPTAGEDAKALMSGMKGSEAARDGMQRNFVEWLQDRTRSTAEAGTSGEKAISYGTFQKALADPKVRAVADAILGPDGVKRLDALQQDLERAQRSVNATNIPGSPGTAADLRALAEHGGENASVMEQVIIGEAIGDLMERVTHVTGPKGALLRGAAVAGKIVLDALRRAGLQRVDDLTIQGTLQPELARVLMRKVPLKPDSHILRDLVRQIGAIGVGTAANDRQ